jgi:eukaryotic-like serine/threonine-protein kinase
LGCLDADTIVALVDGNLGDSALSAAQQHIATCQSCSDLVAAAGSGGSPRLQLDAPALAKGASFGRYVILELVGRGGMGEVYAAYDPQLDRKVALKLLRRASDDSTPLATGRERLLREAKAIARLSHPNVVVVHDAGEIGDRVFLAMEFIDGATLAEWLHAQPRSVDEIRDAFAAAGAGLAAAHHAGLVHRDFKPQNVMVGRDGAIRVMDFGLASDTGRDTGDAGGEAVVGATDEAPSDSTVALTRTGMLLGTPLYMSPEQLLGQGTDARTDQFSFCVALYHALYGERPFASESLKVLLEAVIAGRVREPPKKARVPAYLRKLLLRGLAREPTNRFPSMSALLEALRADPLRRRHRLAVGAGVALLAVAAVTATFRATTTSQRLCQGANERLAGAWELTPDGSRRQAMRAAFTASGSPFADESSKRVFGILDDYAKRWVAAYTDACEATHVRGDQSSEVLDLRMACLDGSRSAVRALTGVLSTPDKDVVLQSINAARELPLLDRCSNVTALRAAVAPPADAETQKRVEDIRTGLAEVRALGHTGQFAEAERKATPLVAAARATGYRPVLADALGALGWTQTMRHDPVKAPIALEEAVWSALSAHRDETALESAAMLVSAVGGDLGRYEEAATWDRLGQALFDRLGPGHERAGAWLLMSRARVNLARGRYQAQLDDTRAAIALYAKALPPDHPDVAIAWYSLAEGLRNTGDLRGAGEAGAKGVELSRKAYGDRNPLSAESYVNYGEVLVDLGRHGEAEPMLRTAVDLMTERFGPDHPYVAYALLPLGRSLVATGHAVEAVSHLERALRIRERLEPSQALIAITRFALARALWAANGDRARARRLATAAHDFYVKEAALAKEATEVATWLNDHALAGRRL